MAESQSTISGFSDHVQEQLHQAVRDVTTSQPSRGRGHRGRGYQHHPYAHPQHQQGNRGYFNSQNYQQPGAQSWNHQPMANLTDANSFPPLGASRPQPPAPAQRQQQPLTHPQPQIMQPPSQPQHQYHHPPPMGQHMGGFQMPRHTNEDHHYRGHRGNYRGRGRGHHNMGNSQYHLHHQQHPNAQNPDDYHRPAPTQRHLFSPTVHPHFQSMDEQRALHRNVMNQSDFLNHIVTQALRSRITAEEQQAKERFRKELETIAQKAISEHYTAAVGFSASEVELKVYGSLGSGFGTVSSDMDLLLAFPQDRESIEDIEIESRRLLEKALLDAGIGARLLTRTRVPILRVCQKPGPELLKNLRECRLMWELEPKTDDPPAIDEGFGALPTLTELQITTTQTAFANLALDAHEVPLPNSPVVERSKLEYDGDCGILCDINFANYLALENTRLLKTYGMCDRRVTEVGLFVKMWAKARDIKTPYRGTLSSYGYLMLVLHYLMNVANPPLIPNLQDLAKQKDIVEGKTDFKLFKGYDTRFVEDMNEIRSVLQVMPRNHESVGSLLRGFFQYYADTRGFHWNQDVISIRTPGGRLTKRAKGWTEAKWAGDKQHVRLRYLLAIEDPFELEHNVGRTVGHSGIVAIRDEFRRAWSAISTIKQDEDKAWYWFSQDGQKIQGEELMSAVESRGDLLRKDQEYHRTKARQLRQALEAKEKALHNAATRENESHDEVGPNGMSEVESVSLVRSCRHYTFPSCSALIHNDEYQVQMRHPKTLTHKVMPRRREVVMDATSTDQICREKRKSACQTWTSFAAYQTMKANILRMRNIASSGRANGLSTKSTQPESKCLYTAPNGDTLGIDVSSRARCLQAVRLQGTDSPDRCHQIECDTAVRYRNKPSQTSDNNVNTCIPVINATNARTSRQMVATTDSRNCYMNDCHQLIQTKTLASTNIRDCSASAKHYDEHVSSIATNDKKSGTQYSQPASIIVKKKKKVRFQNFEFKSDGLQRDSRSQPFPGVPCIDTTNAQTFLRTQLRNRTMTGEDNLPTTSEKISSQTLQSTTPSLAHDHDHLVPLTLYPHMPHSRRPRDEDPNIMPIPRRLNFQFDLRHLADLDVIRRGGNGCARAGEEFDVEIEFVHEFGGCGRLGRMARSRLCRESESETDCTHDGAGCAEMIGEGESGVEALLGELPGVLDD